MHDQQGDDMFAALAEGASHPAVAAWLAIGTAGLAAVVVAMAWNVNARQIRLAELLTRRQFPVTSEASTAGRVARRRAGTTRVASRTPAPGRRSRVPPARSQPPAASRCRLRLSKDPTR